MVLKEFGCGNSEGLLSVVFEDESLEIEGDCALVVEFYPFAQGFRKVVFANRIGKNFADDEVFVLELRVCDTIWFARRAKWKKTLIERIVVVALEGVAIFIVTH